MTGPRVLHVGGWGVAFDWNPWLSLGFHLDHRDPFVDIHLPGVVLTVGNIHRQVWATTAYNENCPKCGGTGSYYVACDCHDSASETRDLPTEKQLEEWRRHVRVAGSMPKSVALDLLDAYDELREGT